MVLLPPKNPSMRKLLDELLLLGGITVDVVELLVNKLAKLLLTKLLLGMAG